MDPVDTDDDAQDRLLTRSNSWSHTQRPPFMDSNQSIGRPPRPSNGLSCIYEADDGISTNQGADFTTETIRNRSKSMSTGTTGAQAQGKKRRHSYTELIASAILSSPEKRKTLAEIYDWFVLNVPSFKDQRYMHSSLGWKNAVRHNLSVQTCFKRVKRHGMEKPSWWTVDLNEVTKRRLVLRPPLSNNNATSDADTEGGPFLPPRRNTYSGPPPGPQSTVNNETNGSHKMTYRVSSTSDLHEPNLQYMNSNGKKSHYTPIRPAVHNQGNEMPVFTLGNTGYNMAESDELAYRDTTGFNDNNNMDDGVFLKPCVVDTSAHGSKNHPHAMVPSVTLVCKESPTSSDHYHQAQLEVSFQANEHGHHSTLSPLSPAGYNWTSSGSSPCSQTSPASNGQSVYPLSHFNTWPNIAASTNTISPVDGTGAPNQTLRIKTLWGNVEDIQFDGLLPMRTVVKCDGMTQTDERNESPEVQKNVTNKNFARAQWGHDPYRYHQSHNFCDHDSTLPADLPEDLAGLQIEGDLHCDIDEVMGASLEPSVNRPMWGGWAWNTSPLDQAQFTDRIDDSYYPDMTHSHSPFSSARMDVPEI